MWLLQPRLLLVIGLAFGCVAGRAMGEAAGSPGTSPITATAPADTSDTLRVGIQHVRAGRYEQAIARLTALYQRDFTYATRQGSVAYWLGRAHLEDGRPKTAVSLWRSCLWTLRERGEEPGIRLADAYIRTVIRQDIRTERKRAEIVYLEMIDRVGQSLWTSLSEGARERLARHLRELAVLLPRGLQRRTGITVDPYTLDVSISLNPAAGPLLAGWWRAQDPLPATERNERLQEHLFRVARARNRYAATGRLDDRGKVFIRLGQPGDTTQIRLSPAAEATPHLAGVRVRENEFWTYPEVDQKAHFLFVQEGPSRYELGNVDKLFPPDVRTGLDRSFDATLSYLDGLERVLRQLATYHEDFGLRSSEAVDAKQAALNQAQFNIGPEEDPNVRQGPISKARDLRRRNKQADQEIASKRARQVPNSYSTIGDRAEELPIETRIARFLNENGETRVEVTWQVKPSALVHARDRASTHSNDAELETTSLLAFSGVREGRNHSVRDRTRQNYVRSSGAPDSLWAYTYETTAEDSVFHLSMQWDQYKRAPEGDDPRGRLMRRHTERHDSLTALRTDPKRLEMSDLKLLTVPSGRSPASIMSEEAVPYPFRQVDADRPLALAFEVYHLGYGANDRTRYTVSYEIERRREQGGLSGFFGGDDREQTTTQTTREGGDRTAEEYILLDLGNLLNEKEGQINVTVRVKDQITDQEVERSLSFEVTDLKDE